MIGKLVGSAGFLSSGGTIGGDLTISGDLTVTGSNTYTYDEQVDGQVWIKDSTASSATQGGHLRLFSDDGAVMASGHRLGVLEFAGAEDTSSTITVGARIEALCDDTWSAAENGADMVFYTTDGNASEGEVLRLTADNNVGIGTAAPDGLLNTSKASASHNVNFDTFSTTAGHGAALNLRHSNHASNTVETADETVLGTINFRGVDNGSNFDTGAGIQVIQNGSAGTKVPSDMSFFISSSSATNTVMKLDANSRISLSNNDTGTSSTVFGYLAGMPGSANALGNIFIGQEAGENVGSHDTDGNIMIGYRAGRGTFTAATDHNVGIGYTALNVLTSGHGNVVMGSGAGIAIQDAESNVAIGRNALGQVVSSNQSIAIGFNSGYGLTTGANNTVIGAEALYNSADIDRAVVIGKNAIYAGNATSGADGTIAIGYDAARALTSGGQNIAIGYEALHDCTTGRRNTVIGYQAADTLTAGSDDNTAVGYAALGAGNHDTTHQNSCFGYGAGDTITTGSNNTCLGSQANVSASGAVGQIAIGQAVTCTADNTATLGIGSNTASLGLDGSDTSWAAASSDKRLKENIETSSAGLDVINDLRPVTYNWKKAKDVDNGMPQYKDSEEPVLGLEYGETLHGFIAQEVKEVVDNHSSLKEGFKMWKLKDDGTQTVADGNLIPILVKAVQELTAKVEELEKK